MKEYTSVIAAVSTPPGKGGVAIIRLSGMGAIDIADSLFKPKNKKSFKDSAPRMQVYGDIIHRGEYLDDGMATLFKSPNSYTGEEMVEISCHGGVTVTSLILEALIECGATYAGKGEFTRRAFINGKLTLTEAEAIGNLLEAKTREQVKLSSGSSRTLLSKRIEEIREGLTSVLSSLYARIDYPDEDLGDFTSEESANMLEEISDKIRKLLSTYKTGKAISEGVKTVICGRTNVGKSSLYNLLLGKDAAIVTDIEGTTRDVLNTTLPLGRVLLDLSDTAGVRDFSLVDTVEAIGIERSLRHINEAELIIPVFDYSLPLANDDLLLIDRVCTLESPKIAVVNKCDLERGIEIDFIRKKFDTVIELSAKSGDISSVESLSTEVEKLFTDEKISTGHDAIISSARQNAELSLAFSYLEDAISALRGGMPIDVSSSDIERALGEIAELDGKAVTDTVVADIFSKFCVGK